MHAPNGFDFEQLTPDGILHMAKRQHALNKSVLKTTAYHAIDLQLKSLGSIELALWWEQEFGIPGPYM